MNKTIKSKQSIIYKSFKERIREKTNNWNIQYEKKLEDQLSDHLEEYDTFNFLETLFLFNNLQGEDLSRFVFITINHLNTFKEVKDYNTLDKRKLMARNTLEKIRTYIKENGSFNFDTYFKVTSKNIYSSELNRIQEMKNRFKENREKQVMFMTA